MMMWKLRIGLLPVAVPIYVPATLTLNLQLMSVPVILIVQHAQPDITGIQTRNLKID
jgi:hypothetical protein